MRVTMGMHMNGFTIAEVAVTIAVLGILVVTSWQVTSSERAFSKGARDAERSADIKGIATEFERYYRTNAAISGPSYPTAIQVTSSLASLFKGTSLDLVQAPGQSGVSLVSAADASASVSPAIDVYVYQPFTYANELCMSGPCVRFSLYYRSERTDEIIVVESMRQQ